MRKCEYTPCERYLESTARRNRRYCSYEHAQQAWKERARDEVASDRCPGAVLKPWGRRERLTEDASAVIQRCAPAGATRYRVYLPIANGTLIYPTPGVAWHLSFEGFRRSGDSFELMPRYEWPRVQAEEHYLVQYLSSGGMELPTRAAPVVLLPSSAHRRTRIRLRTIQVGGDAESEGRLLFPRETLRTMLAQTAGNVTRAAGLLNVQRDKLAWELRKAGIKAAEYRQRGAASGPDKRPQPAATAAEREARSSDEGR